MTNETLAILTNAQLIAVNQDPLGVQGTRVQVAGARSDFTDVYGDPLACCRSQIACRREKYASP